MGTHHRPLRHLAIAADAELRRRHPSRKIEPLRSAEPSPLSGTEHEQLNPSPDRQLTETATWIRDLAVQHRAFRQKMDERLLLTNSGKDPEGTGLSEGLPTLWASHPDAILQPPKPQITPSARILELAAEHDTEPEAGA
jgi:hypothetical protein